MQNKRVLVLLYNPFVYDSRVLKECGSLIKAGYEVDLWALKAQGLKERENIQGINVHRRFGFLNIESDKNISKEGNSRYYLLCSLRSVYKCARAICYKIRGAWYRLRFMYGRSSGSNDNFLRLKMIFSLINRDLIEDFEAGDYSFIHCNDITPLNLAVELKSYSKSSVKIVYDCHEYQSEERPNKGLKNRLLNKMIQSLERHHIKNVDAVITVSEGIADEYVRLYNIKRPAIIMNCPKYSANTEKADHFRKIFGISKEQTIFLYQGGFSAGRGIEMIIDAFQTMNDPNKVVIFMGYGNLESKIKELSKKSKNIYYVPAVSPDVLLEYTASADVGICFIENTCLSYYYCLPNKLFEYIMAGIPVICSNLFEIKKLNECYKIGVVTDEISTEDLITAVNKISEMDKEQLKENVSQTKEIFNWENQEKVLLDLYDSLTHPQLKTL